METGKHTDDVHPDAVSESADVVRVLVVDDDEGLRRGLTVALGRAGFEAVGVEHGRAGLEALERSSFDVVLSDVQMPVMNGPQFLDRVKEVGYPVEVIMMTAFIDIATAVNAVRAGAYAFLTKPFVSNEAVLLEVRKAAEHKRLRETMARLQRELSSRTVGTGLVGTSPPMRELQRRIVGVAAANATVLILGESGCGKELVARAIHDRSKRANKPLVTVNCGAIPKDLVESELFGHVRGAFTNAVHARTGLFEAAHGGTIFLDEIGDLPTSAQVKLLRTLQEGEVKPVGSDATKMVDVRVVAATNVDLKAAIAAGTFRQDLFYRLNVIDVRVPALRERGEDIPLLAQHFVQKHVEAAGRSAMRLSPETALCLRQYAWPGNVRELEHAMEHAVVFTDGDTIEVSALPAEIRRADRGAAAAPTAPEASSETAEAPPRRGSPGMGDLIVALGLQELGYAEAKKCILAKFNDAYLAAVLDATHGNVSEAARRSKLDRSNFRRLIRPADGKPRKDQA